MIEDFVCDRERDIKLAASRISPCLRLHWQAGFLLAFLLLLSSISGCRDAYQWRQKMTIVVNTPHGMRSGSSVVQVSALYGHVPMTSSEVEYDVTGEATVIEVAEGRYVFALLGHDEERVARTFRDVLPTSRRDWLPLISKVSGSRSVPFKELPTFVTFGNLQDPRSIKRLDPLNFTAVLGPGYSFRAATIEITSQPMTTGEVAKILPWMSWSSEQWIEFAAGGLEPMQLLLKNGNRYSITRSDFISRR